MPMVYYANGNTVVQVDGSDLGIAEGQVEVHLRWKHYDIPVDDFGGELGAPGEVLWMLADAQIIINLVHFNVSLLNTAIRKSMAGGTLGTFVGAGTLMTGNYMSLRIPSPVMSQPWTFNKSYLAEQPLVWPLGNERSIVRCHWRAIGIPAATAEMLSAGAELFED